VIAAPALIVATRNRGRSVLRLSRRMRLDRGLVYFKF